MGLEVEMVTLQWCVGRKAAACRLFCRLVTGRPRSEISGTEVHDRKEETLKYVTLTLIAYAV